MNSLFFIWKVDYSNAHIKIFESEHIDPIDKWIGWSSYQKFSFMIHMVMI